MKCVNINYFLEISSSALCFAHDGDKASCTAVELGATLETLYHIGTYMRRI